ncbi:CDP-alcohol phosphatidyltransferase family protein [Candidatus Methylacidiphilum fumarolicum]|uniref:CDP-diacylglycerol--glycerol-3-phosphate 3-phosphatidyltransferase n=2 Tax=Candidatus Methylacidiphilum fumarolicum TaxID=591154 RepID=I0JVL8_METFB|nr:CDP-alcohol phosphatidyltransferase family protein [Candidatus Methylacidiphilum fumarolicum]MBW6414043.1 CDP-alcohol phosphatidyltransferase family protein [Candidatus Methylacidiphilum fumarolicum]TFE66390.1 phosphatidylglycerophosphate synthase [Candidatus Methylacidiphilum fumarolicum]TFE75271.1 CDP-alcohol phosphatidyltransferase family protein [Candidatus Methylacidiphilum fumarolicum]TFE76117.1 CDP-alcohol phosphatidyltransferase family protein [Candidatus Methylacidiphilum fumarolicu
MTLASWITLFRIVSLPLILFFLKQYEKSDEISQPDEKLRAGSLIFFLVAAFSDCIDGYLARNCGQKSKLGAILDPIADKLLLFVMLFSLATINASKIAKIPLWLPLLIASRDLFLLFGFLFLKALHKEMEVQPHWTGKLATFMSFSLVGFSLLGIAKLTNISVYLCALFLMLSSIVYSIRAIKILLSQHHHSVSPTAKKDNLL